MTTQIIGIDENEEIRGTPPRLIGTNQRTIPMAYVLRCGHIFISSDAANSPTISDHKRSCYKRNELYFEEEFGYYVNGNPTKTYKKLKTSVDIILGREWF